MTWPFDDSDLPLHDGVDVGGAQERSMAHSVGGYQGIRTVEELNPDGSLTRLRTRWGRPIFETDPVRASSSSQKYRGFVAKASSRAVLFDPYTLTVLDANYTPALNTYSVQDFATSWNVPVSDTTDWYDVVMFDGQTIKVNAKAMPTLGIVANQAFQAIPYVINRNDASDQYGNAERNATEKRVFAVGRSDVQSWGGSGVIETLTPTDARTEDRAMTVGQRVDFSTDTAWLGQLFYPAAQTWDGAGEWYYTSAQVQMLLTSTYLVKVAGNSNVAMTPPALANDGTAPGSASVAAVFPPTPVGMYATGSIVSSVNWQTTTQGYVYWYWAGVVEQPLHATVAQTFTRTDYSGSAASSEIQSGRTLDYVADNAKYWRTVSETSTINPQTVTLGGSGYFDTDKLLSATTTALFWEDAYIPSAIPATRGVASRSWASTLTITGSGVSRDEEVQTGSFSVTKGSDTIVSVSIFKSHMVGDQLVMEPNTTYYSGYIGKLSYSGSFGMGNSGLCRVHVSDVSTYKNPTGVLATQPPAAISEINAEAAAMSAAMAASVYYDSENSSGTSSRSDFYWPSISPLDNLVATLDWTTKDFILYDETNGVYIFVEGVFSGTGTSATLTVNIKVQTRFGIASNTVGSFNYTYSELLPEVLIATGKYAVPSPQIRAIFAPLYQEQGSFKGAHYVTAEEEGNGATPAHLFNFLLYLKPYSDLSTVNDDNLGPAVHFVPCNLLEMLYAFVFSQEYGVSASGARYPVTFPTRYNDMMSTLFTNAIRVSVRDGVQGNWSDSLGSDFAAISTVSLHRM